MVFPVYIRRQTERQHDIEKRRVPHFEPFFFVVVYCSSDAASLTEPANLVSMSRRVSPKCFRSTCSDHRNELYRKDRIGHTKVQRMGRCARSGRFPEESPIRTDWYFSFDRSDRILILRSEFGISSRRSLDVIVSLT